MWEAIGAAITEAEGRPFTLQEPNSVGGGCISSAWQVRASEGREFFVKTHKRQNVGMFAAEAEGLNEIVASQTIRVPRAIAWGETGQHAYLVLEYLDLGRRGSQRQLAEELAAMHRHLAPRFGWRRDNTIGASPQRNTEADDWCGFFRDQRLGFQLQLAADKGYGGSLQRQGERLQADLHHLLEGHRPQPSLLHGDLWSGNYGFTREEEPVIFDPAVYYGDREADIAMTELFGGFSAEFYRAYDNAWPLAAGYEIRKGLYNLYHILNHLNLFGGGYRSQAEGMIARLLSEIA